MRSPDIYEPQLMRRKARYSIRGFDYAVSEWGERGKPMFFWLHGWGDCSATFQFVVDRLQGDWHVIAPDFRGFGESRGKAAAYWFPDYLADLDALLRIYSPDERVRLVGHSMGANIAGLYAGSFPERVSTFVNIEGFGLRDTSPGEAPGRYRQWIEASRETQAYSEYEDFNAFATRLRKRNPRMSEAAAEFVARCWASEQDGRIGLRADPLHKLPNPILYRRAEAEACWRQVSAPVLLVAGGESAFAGGDHDFLDTGSLDLPFQGARRHVIDAAGHMMHFEAPAELAEVIEGFLAEHL